VFCKYGGGQLIIGVSNSQEIIGVEDIDKTMRAVDDVAYHRCEPPITVIQETVVDDNKVVLIINIPKGIQRPYRTRSGQYYIRSTNRCRQASREELLRLFQASESIFFDETFIARAKYSDLDLDFFYRFAQDFLSLVVKEEDVQRYLRNLHLIDHQNRPTLSGMLFFGEKPQDYIPYAKIICAYIKGSDIAIPPTDKKEIIGKTSDLLEKTQTFLKLYLPEKHEIKGFESEIVFEIPEAALREAIVNAIAHRDYTISAPIRILIYEDRVEIITPGRLPNTVTIESMKVGGSHVLRNPTIYNLLSKMGMVTDLGSGVRRIIYLVKNHLNKEVDFLEMENEFILTIPRRSINYNFICQMYLFYKSCLINIIFTSFRPLSNS
jgi:ATP-dependent DNA helicase RecG